MLKMLGKFMHHVLPGVVKPLHVLWNQVIGFFFLTFAGIAVPQAIKDSRNPEVLPRFVLTLVFIVIMAGFAAHSFLKARKVSRTS